MERRRELPIAQLASQPSASFGARQTGVEPMTYRNQISTSCSPTSPDNSSEAPKTGTIHPIRK